MKPFFRPKLIPRLIMAAFVCAAPAMAGPTELILKSAPTDQDGTITLGDLFENAAGLSPVIIARRSAQTAVLDAAEVQTRVAQSGARWQNPHGLRRIIVRQGLEGVSVKPTDTMAHNTANSLPSPETLSATPMVTKGQIISVVWQKGAIRLSLEGMALGPARAGSALSL